MSVITRIATVGVLTICLTGCSSGSSSVPVSTSAATPTRADTAQVNTVAEISNDTAVDTIADTVTDSVPGTARGTSTELSEFGVLVFHRTAGFRHDSIPAGVAALTEMGSEGRFTVTATEDPAVFTDDGLAAFQVIVFLSTTGDILLPEQEQAMERFIRAGGGFVGVHAAADTEYDWAWYGGLVGAYFQSHPAPQPGRVVVPGEHPITAGVPEEFVVQEEWYDFQSLPADSVTVLATVDESSYTGGSMGEVHPIVWAHEYDGGRAAYLAFGHDAAAFSEPPVRLMLGQTITWAAA